MKINKPVIASRMTLIFATRRKFVKTKITVSTRVSLVLVDNILKMESKFRGLTRNDVHIMAYLLANHNHLKDRFGESGMTGKSG